MTHEFIDYEKDERRRKDEVRQSCLSPGRVLRRLSRPSYRPGYTDNLPQSEQGRADGENKLYRFPSGVLLSAIKMT
jgi:hypothetical protein